MNEVYGNGKIDRVVERLGECIIYRSREDYTKS